MAAHFGYSLGVGAIPVKKFSYADQRRDGRKVRKDVVVAEKSASISSRNYQKLVAKIEGKPEERILSYLMLRSLKQARYSAENAGHFALAADALHALHFAHPALSRSDRASPAEARPATKRRRPTEPELRAIAEDCSSIGAARRGCRARAGGVEESEVHGVARWARSSTRWSSAPPSTACSWSWRSCSSKAWCPSTRCPATATPITRTCARSSASARGASFRSATSVRVIARSRGCRRAQAAVFDRGAGARAQAAPESPKVTPDLILIPGGEFLHGPGRWPR